MGSQPMQLTQDQALKAYKAELAAVQKVTDLKSKALGLLGKLSTHADAGDWAGAISCYVQVQKLEYQLQLDGLKEKQTQVEGIIKQLESPITSLSAAPVPPFPPFGTGRRS
jgi:hypothetical protein